MKTTKLIDIREENELSQREMAKKLNVSKSTYARWETLELIIPLQRLNDFCNTFDISMDYVFKLNSTNIKYKKINTIDKKLVGKKIKQIRLNNKLTQEQLAFFLNTTHSTISAYENGKTLILTVFALEICKKYNVSLDWLCGRI